MAKRSTAATRKRCLRQRRTETRRQPRDRDHSVHGERSTVTAYRLQHGETDHLTKIGEVWDANGVRSRPSGRVDDTLHRLKAKGTIDEAAYAAGLHLQDLAAVARLEPIGSAPLERVNCGYSDGPLTDAMLDARAKLRTAFGYIKPGTFAATACYWCICVGITIGALRELERKQDGSMHDRMWISGQLCAGLEQVAAELYGNEPVHGHPQRPKMQCLHGEDIFGLAGQRR